MFHLPLVQSANLSHNAISKLQLTLVDGTQSVLPLRVLDVSHNRITAVLPGSSDVWPNLEELYLQFNEIKLVSIVTTLNPSKVMLSITNIL